MYAGYERMLAGLPEERQHSPEVDAIHWMIEELRVSLFAQTLGTPIPVSEKRVLSAMEKVR